MLEHGGNLAQAAQQYGIAIEDWLDLSTGINPNHYPIAHIPTSAWQRLPEENDGLIEAACQYYGCEALLPTSGSQAALQVLPKLRPPSLVAMPRTMYQEHAKAWQQHGHRIIFFDDAPDASLLNQVEVLLLCNPNNPTGLRFSKAQLLEWQQQLAQRGAWLIVDEAFMDTTPEHSIADHSYLQGLFVLRSLGKFFGLAGARIGFLLAAPHILKQAEETLGPWALAGPSRIIAKQALLDQAWQIEMRQKLILSAEKLTLTMTQSGLKPQGGTQLFQYVQTPSAAEIHHALAQQGIWVRLFKDRPALRFGLPPDDAWLKLASALKSL